jgi:hypothetical protein
MEDRVGQRLGSVQAFAKAGPGSSQQRDSVLMKDTTPQVPSSPPVQPAVPSKPGISRRTVLVGIAGLVVVGGGTTWLLYSQGHPMPVVSNQTPTPRPTGDIPLL